MGSEMMRLVTRVGSYSLAVAVGVMSVFALLTAGELQAAETVRLVDGSFDAGGYWGQGVLFTPPCDGKLVLTFENPDSSADANLTIWARKPSDYYPSMLWERPVLSGYTASPAFMGNTVKGFPTNTIEFSTYQSWGEVTLGIQYDLGLGAGIDNTGTDRVTIDFVPETIESTIPSAQFLTRLVSQPYESNEVSVNFNAIRPGKLILRAVQKGSGGGGHMLYVDGYGIGGIDTGEFNYSGANYKTLLLREAGNHVLKVSHEDSVFGDNYGVREVEVYFVADKPTDLVVPNTTATATGTTGDNGWLLSNATIALAATDLGSGVKEIHYTVDTGAETVVAAGAATFAITSDGNHVVTYFAVDNAGNAEAPKTLAVRIDRSAPAVEMDASPKIIKSRGHHLVDVSLNGSASDSLSGISSVVITVTDEYGKYNLNVPGFGSTVQLEAWVKDSDLSGRTYTVTAVARDNAGNSTVRTTKVLVLYDHDGDND